MGTVVLYAGALAAGTFRVAKEGDRRAYVLDADAIRWGARRRFVSRSRLSWCYSSCRQAGRSSSAMRDLWHVRLGVLEAFGFGMRHPDPVTPAECSRVGYLLTCDNLSTPPSPALKGLWHRMDQMGEELCRKLDPDADVHTV